MSKYCSGFYETAENGNMILCELIIHSKALKLQVRDSRNSMHNAFFFLHNVYKIIFTVYAQMLLCLYIF